MDKIKQHECCKMPFDPTGIRVVKVAKFFHINIENGSTFGEISWKLFEATNVPVFGCRPNHIGKKLDPPICPFCDTLLIEEDEKVESYE